MRKWMVLLSVVFVLWFVPWVFVLHLGGVAYFPYRPDGQTRFVRVVGPVPGWLHLSDWANAAQIPRSCKRSLVAAEDGHFFEHVGIDSEGIENAIKRNRRSGKLKAGGSTITQQLIKNVFLYRDKTYLRKAREILGALLLDVVMTKEDQVTWYFNVVEFGPNIYGIKSAANYYFKKAPQNLSLSECATLVAVLRDPVKSARRIKSGVLPGYLAARRDRIMARARSVDEFGQKSPN